MSTHRITLQDISETLLRELPIFAVFTSVNTRVILQTGINLKKIKPEQNDNPAAVQAVRDALARMGFDLEKQNVHV